MQDSKNRRRGITWVKGAVHWVRKSSRTWCIFWGRGNEPPAPIKSSFSNDDSAKTYFCYILKMKGREQSLKNSQFHKFAYFTVCCGLLVKVNIFPAVNDEQQIERAAAFAFVKIFRADSLIKFPLLLVASFFAHKHTKCSRKDLCKQFV